MLRHEHEHTEKLKKEMMEELREKTTVKIKSKRKVELWFHHFLEETVVSKEWFRFAPFSIPESQKDKLLKGTSIAKDLTTQLYDIEELTFDNTKNLRVEEFKKEQLVPDFLNEVHSSQLPEAEAIAHNNFIMPVSKSAQFKNFQIKLFYKVFPIFINTLLKHILNNSEYLFHFYSKFESKEKIPKEVVIEIVQDDTEPLQEIKDDKYIIRFLTSSESNGWIILEAISNMSRAVIQITNDLLKSLAEKSDQISKNKDINQREIRQLIKDSFEETIEEEGHFKQRENKLETKDITKDNPFNLLKIDEYVENDRFSKKLKEMMDELYTNPDKYVKNEIYNGTTITYVPQMYFITNPLNNLSKVYFAHLKDKKVPLMNMTSNSVKVTISSLMREEHTLNMMLASIDEFVKLDQEDKKDILEGRIYKRITKKEDAENIVSQFEESLKKESKQSIEYNKAIDRTIDVFLKQFFETYMVIKNRLETYQVTMRKKDEKIPDNLKSKIKSVLRNLPYNSITYLKNSRTGEPQLIIETPPIEASTRIEEDRSWRRLDRDIENYLNNKGFDRHKDKMYLTPYFIVIGLNTFNMDLLGIDMNYNRHIYGSFTCMGTTERVISEARNNKDISKMIYAAYQLISGITPGDDFGDDSLKRVIITDDKGYIKHEGQSEMARKGTHINTYFRDAGLRSEAILKKREGRGPETPIENIYGDFFITRIGNTRSEHNKLQQFARHLTNNLIDDVPTLEDVTQKVYEGSLTGVETLMSMLLINPSNRSSVQPQIENNLSKLANIMYQTIVEDTNLDDEGDLF